MTFVQWVTAAVLLIVTLGGLVGGVLAIVRRRVDVPPYVIEGRGALLLSLVYFAGSAAALAALFFLLTSPNP